MGLAESQIYLNGTSIEKSVASYDAFHWLDDGERHARHGEYEFLSLELLAEIHIKNPGYVNILPGVGAGRSLAAVGEEGGARGRWQSWRQREDLARRGGATGAPAAGVDANMPNGERLWVTGFSLTNPRGELHTMDVGSGVISSVSDGTARAIQWPNEVASIPQQAHTDQGARSGEDAAPEDALLVADGFLVPGKDTGGLYVVRKPGNGVAERTMCLTGLTNLRGAAIAVGERGWFYHRAVWMDLTGDGRLSILTTRAQLPLLRGQADGAREERGRGELVWLERPQPHAFDDETGTALDADGTVFDPFSTKNTPWKLRCAFRFPRTIIWHFIAVLFIIFAALLYSFRVLTEGPDVMFSVADLDPSDDSVEILASQFFGKKLSLHSLKIGPDPKIVFQRTIDERCGAAFSSVLADLDGLAALENAKDQPIVVDAGSTVVSLKQGDGFSHLLVTSHECSYVEKSSSEASIKSSQGDTLTRKPAEVMLCTPSIADTCSTEHQDQSKTDGGSLFAYRVPSGKGAWKTQPWTRSVIATGFKVQGQLSNVINPGAPGFCYPFFPTREEGSAGVARPWRRPLLCLSGDCAESAYILRPTERGVGPATPDDSTRYALMCEIQCGATVGSLAVGYDNLHTADQQSGYAKIYVPCYEQDKVLVFSMGSGKDE